jgi:hypothetical protein
MKQIEKEALYQQRLEQAKQDGYLHALYLADLAPLDWERYCKEHNMPCIVVHTRRKGLAELSINSHPENAIRMDLPEETWVRFGNLAATYGYHGSANIRPHSYYHSRMDLLYFHSYIVEEAALAFAQFFANEFTLARPSTTTL